MRNAWLLAMSLVLCACNMETLDQRACPPDGTTLTYDDFGKPFLDEWCNTCHGAAASDRNGAPPNITFDTQDQAVEWKARIFALAADDNTSMPLGSNIPSSDDRHKLGDWLACGVH
jgi:uncharacterized membrane protein